MKAMRWNFLPLAIFISLSIFFVASLFLNPKLLPSTKINQPLAGFQLPRLDNVNYKLTPLLFRDKVVLLNIWASWCSSCAEEQPLLLKLANMGIAIYGVNYKDRPEKAKLWLKTHGDPYRYVGMDLEGKWSMQLGVYGTPETFVIDKKGIIRYRHVGVLSKKIWHETILPLIKSLEN